MAVSSWSTNAASNTTVGAINIAEGCPAANMNNAIREVMAQVRQFSDGLGNSYQAKDALLTALAGLSTSANQLIYSTGVDTVAMTGLTAFARTILDDNDGAAVCATIGAVRVLSLSLANPGHIRLQVGPSSAFQVAWGMQTLGQDQTANVSYSSPFTSFSVPLVSSIAVNAVDAKENTGYAPGSATVTGFQLRNAENSTISIPWLAVGV